MSTMWKLQFVDQNVIALPISFLIAVVVSLMTKKIDEKDAKIEALSAARLDDNKTHSADYREMAKNDQAVLLGNAQASERLADKIEAVKGRR